MSSEKQRERYQRGQDFETDILESLRLVPNTWTIKISDGRGGSRPADRLIITEEVNILAELKRTAGYKFHLSFLRTNQIQGLLDFDQVVDRNYGLVFINFHNPKKGIDVAYAFRLITALKFMKKKDVQYISHEDFKNQEIPNLYFPLRDSYYDLKGVKNCKLL